MKKHIVEHLVNSTGFTQAAANRIVDAVVKAIGETVRTHGEAQIQGFGTFKNTRAAARTMTNPRTGEPIRVEERNVLKFKASKNFIL